MSENPIIKNFEDLRTLVGPHYKSFSAYDQRTMEIWRIDVDSQFPEPDYRFHDFKTETRGDIEEKDFTDGEFAEGKILLIKGFFLTIDEAEKIIRDGEEVIAFNVQTREASYAQGLSYAPDVIYFKPND